MTEARPIVPPRYGAREAQPLDDILARADAILGEMGLDVSLKPATSRRDLDDDEKRLAQAAALIAATHEGRILLEGLADITVRRPVYLAHMNLDPMRAYAIGCQREGQNQMFFALLAMIARGRAETPTTRDGAS